MKAGFVIDIREPEEIERPMRTISVDEDPE